MKVVYHVHTYFFDNALEVINVLKNHVELYVFIEVSHESVQSNIFHIEQNSLNGEICDLRNIVSKEYWGKIESHLNGTKQVRTILYKGKRTISIENIFTIHQLKKEIESIQPDLIHFDTISNRCIWLYYGMNKYKLTATLHDPLPHAREGSWKQAMSRSIFNKYADAYFFHSEYAHQLYLKSNYTSKKKGVVIGMKPFETIRNFKHEEQSSSQYILFFGRISYYKGIDLLLKAIPNICKEYPNTHFYIAGKSNNTIQEEFKIAQVQNTLLIDEYISIERLTSLIVNAKFIVCPYREATQSGVLMTAFALHKPVLATRVGAFSEYIEDDVNGLLVDTSVESITNGVMYALEKNKYLAWENSLKHNVLKVDKYENIHEYYHSICEA